jgi:hypothetical protein
MPRNDFVQTSIDTVERTAPVVDSTVSGVTLQHFLIKQKFVLYGGFCQNMVGLQHPTDVKCVKELSDVDVQLMASVLTEDLKIRKPFAEGYSVNEAYHTVKLCHDFAMDPDGLQIANYVTLLIKCLFIGMQIGPEQVRVPKFFDAFCNSLSEGTLETLKNFIDSMERSQGEAMTVLRKFSEKTDRLSRWPDQARWMTLFPRFTEETHKFCLAQAKVGKVTLQTLSKHFKAPQGRGEDLPLFKRFYANCGNIGIEPYWMFYEAEDPVEQTLVDTSSLVTCPPFNQLYKLASETNRRARDKLLGFPWMRKAWDAMSTIIVLHDPFTGQLNDFVKKESLKFWSNPLSKKDFNKSSVVMANFVEEIRVRKIKITQGLCRIFVKFLTNITTAVEPIPGLERQPTPSEDDARHKKILQQEIQGDGPDIGQLEQQLAERREQLAKFPIEKPTDDSGVFLPVLLLGLGIFLLTS